MKLCASSLLVLILSGTLIAQSKTPQSQPRGFPKEITHVVVMIQENRSPDNLFHFLSPLCTIPRGAKGLAACMPNPVTNSCYDISPCGLSNESGSPQPVTLKGISLASNNDPGHAHNAFEEMCDPNPDNGFACQNDGAWKTSNNSYSYVENSAVKNYDGSSGYLLGPYLTYAEQYGWANFMYQTNQGPSYPAHQFLFSGTSARTAAEDANSTFISDNFNNGITEVGCLAPSKATNLLISPLPPGENPCPDAQTYDDDSVQLCPVKNTALNQPKGNPVGSFCTDKPNMGEVLDGQKISWKYYAPSDGSIWTAPNSIENICVPQFIDKQDTQLECTGPEWNANVDFNLKGADVLNDIANCSLASVSWVIPNGTWSDHPGLDSQYGPSWVAAVINAIGQNPRCPGGTLDAGQTFWQNTAIILTWDDWGGWSDNQPAFIQRGLPCISNNCQADYQMGFRVPLIIVSAYTPKGYIDNDNYDFGSVLRTIEGIFGIQEGTMGLADARSTTDFANFFTGSFRQYVPVPAVEPPSFFLGEEAQKGPPVPPDND